MAEDCAEISVETSWTLYLLRCADVFAGDNYRSPASIAGTQCEWKGRVKSSATAADRSYQLPVASKSIGLQLEYRIKQLRRKDKERLVLGALDPASLIPGEAVAASDSPRSRTTTDKPDSEQS
ncbi:MAG: hypothetical protein ACE37N_04080 [Pseudohongiellaceae bacterium]